jgi:hypothetical protein
MFLLAGRESINRPDRIAKLREIVERTRAELETFVAEARGSASAWGEPVGGAASEPSAEATAGAGEQAESQQGPEGPVEQL